MLNKTEVKAKKRRKNKKISMNYCKGYSYQIVIRKEWNLPPCISSLG